MSKSKKHTRLITEKQGERRVSRLSSVSPEKLRSAFAAFAAGATHPIGGSGRCSVVRVAFDTGGEVVLKIRDGRTLRGKIADAVQGTFAARAFKSGRKLAAAGVPVPEMLASIEERERATLIMRFVRGRTLQDVLEEATNAKDAARVRRLVTEAGRTAARLHAAGATHGDLKPHNVIVQGEGGGFVICDLEGVRFDAARGGRRLARDLAALDAYGQRLPKKLGVRSRKAAFDAYAEARGLSPEAAAALLRQVIVESRKKRERWRAAGIK